MEGYINENRWIDLSGLPRVKNRPYIDWGYSVGYVIPFRYKKANGYIHILDHKEIRVNQRVRHTLLITIDKYATNPFWVRSKFLTDCSIKRYVENRIIDFRPDLVQYLDNIDDAYHFAVHSKEVRPMRCPICGLKKPLRIDQVSRNGFFCDNCSDGKSLPNKLMFAVLKQLNVTFINEVGKNHGFDWMQSYRYDFYFKSSNRAILIEMDGAYHSLEYQKQNDAIKTRLAEENGFELIRIDCDYASDAISYIVNNIKHSKLADILDLNRINWHQCQKDACTNLVLRVCSLWENEYLSSREISERLGICMSTVSKYLKHGKNSGICPTYNVIESNKRGRAYMGKRIALLYNNEIIKVFKGTTEALVESAKITGHIYQSQKSINNICRGYKHGLNGFDFKYITREEYEQHKMIEKKNNEVVNKEGIAL